MKERCVVKVGSGVLSGGADALDPRVVRRLSAEVAAARRGGAEVVIVSSGAILAGWRALGLKERPRQTQLKQAAAAVGQSRLMRLWEAGLSRHGLQAAQILLTREDLHHRDRYLNARNTLFALLSRGAVPVINENDTVAVDEIKFGDNDVLSALVAGLCGASRLILLTDQDGLYTGDPRKDPGARLIATVPAGAPAPAAGKAGPSGTGGMQSKVTAARMAAAGGVPAIVANGLRPGTLADALRGDGVGTFFEPRAKPLDKRKQWLAFAALPKGTIIVDEGAHRVLMSADKSLLPSGVRALLKTFSAGEVVRLVFADLEFARGITSYGSEDLERIKGRKTSEILALLGRKPADEVVHRDNLVVLE